MLERKESEREISELEPGSISAYQPISGGFGHWLLRIRHLRRRKEKKEKKEEKVEEEEGQPVGTRWNLSVTRTPSLKVRLASSARQRSESFLQSTT